MRAGAGIAIAAHAGVLHDLRVALRKHGGEWLELGRWLGGPPLPEMRSLRGHIWKACPKGDPE